MVPARQVAAWGSNGKPEIAKLSAAFRLRRLFCYGSDSEK